MAHINVKDLSKQIFALPAANQAIGGEIAQVSTRKILDKPLLEIPSGN
jgi:hypothetical protein